MMVSISNYEDVLRSTVLSFVSEEGRNALLANSDILTVDPGSNVPRGKQPENLFLLLEGEFTFISQQGIEVGYSKAGRTFELGTLFSKAEDWSYRWRCDRRSRILVIPWAKFIEELSKDKQALVYLARVSQVMALQKLKRDLYALNFSKDLIVEIITNFSEVTFEDLFSDWNRKFLVAIHHGEIGVSVVVNGQKNSIASFQIGDACFIDLRNSQAVYESSPGGRAFVLFEEQWVKLKKHDEFKVLYKLFNPQPPDVDEKTFVRAGLSDFINQASGGLKPSTLNMGHIPRPMPSLGEVSGNKLSNKFWARWRLSRAMRVQSDDIRSGAASIASVLKFHGFEVSLSWIENLLGSEGSGRSLSSLASICKQVGIQAQTRELNHNKSLAGHELCLLRYGNKCVVFLYDDGDVVAFGDPEDGKVREISRKLFMKRIVGNEILFLSPNQSTSSQAFQFTGVSLGSYIWLIRKRFGLVFLYILAGFFSYICSLAGPFLSQYIFDTVIPSGNLDLLREVGIAAVAVAIIGIYFDYYQSGISGHLRQSFSALINSGVYSHVFRMPAKYFKQGGSSGILGRMNETDVISNFLVSNVVGVASALLLSTVSFFVLWSYRPEFVLMVLAMVPLQLILVNYLGGEVVSKKTQDSVVRGRENGMYQQHFSAGDQFWLSRFKIFQRWQYEKNLLSGHRIYDRQARIDSFVNIFGFMSGEVVRISVIIYSGFLFSKGEMSLGKVLAISMVVQRVAAPIQQVVSAIYGRFSVQAAVRRLDHIFASQKEAKDIYVKYPDEKFKGAIKFNNVTFSFENLSKPSIKNLNLDIAPGEFVVILGPTGCGKSSLASLISFLDAPNQGQILIDGKIASQYKLGNLRKQIGFVQQEGALFGGTIRENITLWEKDLNQERLMEVLKITDLEEFVLASKEGLATSLGSLGAGVSEGQKQRLLLARALYSEPSILVLDESTSHLDPISEERVISRLLEKFKGKTVVFFTQRIHLANRADRIIFLDKGTVAESGSHSSLINQKGRYFDFYCSHLSLG
jgi:ABC-type bacteriocin/lantibiotic exporter with double-glycine peptidase domain